MAKRLTQLSLPMSIVSILTLVASLICLQFSHYQHSNRSDSNVNKNDIQSDELNSAQQLAILQLLPKFGYKNLFANWTFLNFLQYFGNSELREIEGYDTSINYFQSIISSDPYFISSYVFLANSVSMYAGQPEQTIDLLTKGLKQMGPNKPSQSFLLWRHKGTDELLFIGDNKAAQKSYQTAADWAEKSSDESAPLVARLSRQTSQFLATDPNSKPAQISAWSDVLLRATDNAIRQKATANIEGLGGTILYSGKGKVTVRYNANE